MLDALTFVLTDLDRPAACAVAARDLGVVAPNGTTRDLSQNHACSKTLETPCGEAEP